MGIQEEINKVNEKRKEPESEAIKMYKKQVNAIQWIKDSDWFKEIVNYWEREVDSIETAYPTIKKEDLEGLQIKHGISSAFLSFLNNLAKTEK